VVFSGANVKKGSETVNTVHQLMCFDRETVRQCSAMLCQLQRLCGIDKGMADDHGEGKGKVVSVF
jgi:hypothetical protein